MHFDSIEFQNAMAVVWVSRNFVYWPFDSTEIQNCMAVV